MAKGATFVDNPIWGTWEKAFAAATRDNGWLSMTEAKRKTPDSNDDGFHAAKRASAGDLVVALDESDGKRTLLTLASRDGKVLVSRDLGKLHAKDRISMWNGKQEVKSQWLGVATRPATLHEVYVSATKRLAVVRVGIVLVSDFESFPVMDHVLVAPPVAQ